MTAYYAFLDNNNVVTEVIPGIDANELIEGLDPETWYGNFRGQVCKRTSLDGDIRGIYAGIGYTYGSAENIFITPQPYPSWVRTGSRWNAPTSYPAGGNLHSWDEATLAWVKVVL